MKSFYIIILFLWINFHSIYSQENALFLPEPEYTQFLADHTSFQSSKTPLKNSKNEAEALLYLFFDAYKNYFSSQDLNSCSFYPSCSGYGLIAVKKHGIPMGMIRTFDRLSRCHGFSTELYELDMRRRVQIDYP